MAELFLKTNKGLERAVNEASNAEQLRENLKAELARQGVIARDTDFGARVIAQPEPVLEGTSVKVSASYGCERIIYIGNARIILTGPSEQDLDQQEAVIRGLRRA